MAVIAPEMGRATKIVSEPFDMIRLWRSAFSTRSPTMRDDPLQLALAEPLRVPREALREGVAHEGRGRGAARLEAHPEPDERAAHERARITRQDPPRVQHDPEIHARPDAVEAQPLLDGDEDLADAEESDDRHDEVEPLHQVHEPEGHPELARDDVEPHRGEDESEQDRDERLERVAAAEADEAREGQELDREELWRAEPERDLRQERGEERDQHDREERADEGRRERRREGLASLPLPGERVPVERGRDRPGLTRDVEQDRGDGGTEERPPVERRQ